MKTIQTKIAIIGAGPAGMSAALAAKEKNVIFGGRLGEYRYYDMHKVVAAALLAAERAKSESGK